MIRGRSKGGKEGRIGIEVGRRGVGRGIEKGVGGQTPIFYIGLPRILLELRGASFTIGAPFIMQRRPPRYETKSPTSI